MSVVFLSADIVGLQTGGGLVTHQEAKAVEELARERTEVYCVYDGSCETFSTCSPDKGVWRHDERFLEHLELAWRLYKPSLCHIYAGTFSKSVAWFKKHKVPVTYTSAAHDKEVSKLEHEKLGIDYAKSYPHLVEEELWQRYLEGYLLADVLIVPSKHSASVKRAMGRTGRIEIIPHGVELPKELKQPPKEFVVGYLGVCGGPDKGLRYLLEAWKSLNYKDAKLVLAGRDSTSQWVNSLIYHFGGGIVEQVGWIDKVSDFYENISLYIQPSCSEGFGLEVAEACAHGRPVICSTGAGACDLVPEGWKYDYLDTKELARKIDLVRSIASQTELWWLHSWQDRVLDLTWDRIRQRYIDVWKSLLTN